METALQHSLRLIVKTVPEISYNSCQSFVYLKKTFAIIEHFAFEARLS